MFALRRLVSALARRILLGSDGHAYSKYGGASPRPIVPLGVELLEQRRLLTVTTAVQSGPWHDPATWDNGVPQADVRAVIRPQMTVTLTGSTHSANEVVVQGMLQVEEAGQDKSLTSRWVHVNSGGVFQIGSQEDPFDAIQFELTLTGSDINASHLIETATGTLNIVNNDGFLMTHSGGRLQFFGDAKLPFTKLAATAQSGAEIIAVENVVERNFDGTTSAASDGSLDWAISDQIVIASSSSDYSDEEVRTITAIENTGEQTFLTLDSPLDQRHYGEIETYGNSQRTWDIDLRAEVALLNRSITIRGGQDTDEHFGDRAHYGSEAGQNLGVGAHVMIMPGSGQIMVDGVRFDQMGQTGQLGRYPMHWHMAGDRSGDVLRNSSITNSNNRGVTVHGTQNVLVQGNVLHDIHGHGFFLEDASETGNVFLHNIALGIHRVGGGVGGVFTSSDPFVVPGVTRGPDGTVNGQAPRGENGESSHDTGQNVPHRFLHSAAYWITNPDNTWIGNISAGSEGSGFWFALPQGVLGLSKDTGLYAGLNPLRTNLRQFDHNTSHSSPVGLTFDRGSDIKPGSSNHYAPPEIMRINFLTAYKHSGSAVYHRAGVGIFNETRFADNFHSSFNTFSQEEHNVLFVGHSRGNSDPGSVVGGFRLYDGPGRIVDSHFAGFAADNAYTFRIEGGANKHALTRAEGITFQEDGTADHLGIDLFSNYALSVDESPDFVAGRPDSIAGVVLDVDGSLTGHGGGGPGHVLTPRLDYYRDATDIAPPGWDAYISDDRFAQFKIGVVANDQPWNLAANAGGVNGQYIPAFRIENGDGHAVVADRWNVTYVQRMYTKLNAGDYTVEFLTQPPPDGFDVLLQVQRGGLPGDATVFRFVDVGRNHKPQLASEATSLNAMRTATQSSYYRDLNGDLWMKIFPSGHSVPTAVTIPIVPTAPLLVENTNDAGPGSLREAIEMANARPGLDEIQFALGSGTHTIQPMASLPVVTDSVIIDGASQALLPPSDGGFESPVQPDNQWEQANGVGGGSLAGSAWTILGGAGITRNISAFQSKGVPAPKGVQHALIQGTGTFRQTVDGFEAGRVYQFSLLTMARQFGSYGNNLKVTLDAGTEHEQILVNMAEVTFDRFTRVTSPTFVATSASHTLTISADRNGGNLSGDRTTFFDDVQFQLATPNAVTIDGSQSDGGSGLELAAASAVSEITFVNFAEGAGILLTGSGGSRLGRIASGVDGNGQPAPNRHGVWIQSSDNTVRESLISGNIAQGVLVEGALANGNRLIGNAIFGNAMLGIDLGGDGVTPNDLLDADLGPNALVNFPILQRAVTNGESTWIKGGLDGQVDTTYDLELFVNGQLDLSGHGEGQALLSETTVITDSAGHAAFSFHAPLAAVGQFLTATATDPEGNTSEFAAGIEVEPAMLTLTLHVNSIAENAGLQAATATVARNTETTTDMTVVLFSSDPSEAVVPPMVTIPAGQDTSAPFAIDAVDDALLDGPQIIVIRAQHEDVAEGVAQLQVDDHELLMLQLDETQLMEHRGPALAWLARSNTADNDQPLVVSLTSDPLNQVVLPDPVVIPAGMNSVSFPVSAVVDGFPDGDQEVELTASAAGYVDGSALVDVLENPFPWHHFALAEDVNTDGEVTHRDVLAIVSEMVREGAYQLPLHVALIEDYYDVFADGLITPRDALTVVRYLLDEGTGEGEAGIATLEDEGNVLFGLASAVEHHSRSSSTNTACRWDGFDQSDRPSRLSKRLVELVFALRSTPQPAIRRGPAGFQGAVSPDFQELIALLAQDVFCAAGRESQ